MKFTITCGGVNDGNASPQGWTFSTSEPTRNHANMVEKPYRLTKHKLKHPQLKTSKSFPHFQSLP